MPRIPSTPNAPSRHANSYARFYAEWSKERKFYRLSCSRKDAGIAWRKLTPDEKAQYDVQARESSELSDVDRTIVDSDSYMDEEDLINNVFSLDSSPVKQQEQLPGSPLFSESWPTLSPSPFGEFLTAGPSTLNQTPSISPSPVLQESILGSAPALRRSSTLERAVYDTFISAIEASPVPGSSSIPPSTPIDQTHPLPPIQFPSDEELLDESGYMYPQSPTFSTLGLDWMNHELFGEAPSTEVSAGVNESSPPTPVPATPTTGYRTLGFPTPGYTPLPFHAQELPSGLDNGQFQFNGVGGMAPEQSVWDAYTYPVNTPQFLPAPPAPIPSVSFPIPAPTPAPVATEQIIHTIGRFPAGDTYQLDGNTRVFDCSEPQAGPSSIDQALPLAAIQQTFDSVNTNRFGQDGKPVKFDLVGVNLLFTASK